MGIIEDIVLKGQLGDYQMIIDWQASNPKVSYKFTFKHLPAQYEFSELLQSKHALVTVLTQNDGGEGTLISQLNIVYNIAGVHHVFNVKTKVYCGMYSDGMEALDMIRRVTNTDPVPVCCTVHFLDAELI